MHSQVHIAISKSGGWMVPARPAAVYNGTGRLRCAVFNDRDHHYEVVSGAAYMFQQAGCDVDVFMMKDSGNIQVCSCDFGRFPSRSL